MTVSVGLFFNGNSSLKFTWSQFISGSVGLSGTDSQALWLAFSLYKKLGSRFFFFSNIKPTDCEDMQQIHVDNLGNAIKEALCLEISILICNGKSDRDTLEGLACARDKKLSVILWCQNDPSVLLNREIKINESIKRVIMVSRRQYLLNLNRTYPLKLTFIYNAFYLNKYVDLVTASFQSDTLRIGYIGATNEYKGFHWLCMAWPKIKASYSNAELWVFGSVHLHDVNRKLGISGVAEEDFEKSFIFPYLGQNEEEWKKNGVTFYGQVGPRQLNQYLTSCSLGIVNPNVNGSIETFCVSALDFQANGVPVIGGYAGGLVETIYNEVTGVLLKDPKLLGIIIVKLLSNPDKLNKLGRNGAKWVNSSFNSKAILENWFKVFDDVLMNRDVKFIFPKFSDMNWKLVLKWFSGLIVLKRYAWLKR